MLELSVNVVYWSSLLNIIFVADIFGLTDEFKHLCQQVTFNVEQMVDVEKSRGVECHMIGPYQHQPRLFTSESDAYHYFIENVNLEGYVKKLEQKLLTISGSKMLVGFSVGGSAIWQLYSQSAFKQSVGAICFYSSQIRHMTQLTPKIPMTLILPSKESHFSVEEMALLLQEKPTVTLDKSEYLHGFMNKLSGNYHPTAYQYYTQNLAELVFELLPKNRTMQINGK